MPPMVVAVVVGGFAVVELAVDVEVESEPQAADTKATAQITTSARPVRMAADPTARPRSPPGTADPPALVCRHAV